MAERFRLPSACTGIDMQYGASYRADSKGYVTVDNPAHAAAIRKSWQAQRGLLDDSSVVRFTLSPDAPSCPACNFSPWPWQSVCPRCQTVIEGASN